MPTREMIVRIVRPSEKPYLPPQETKPLPVKPKPRFYALPNLLVLIAIALLTTLFSTNLVKFGVSGKEIAVLIGIPLAFGVFTRSVV
jgi:hypothetical protein